MGRLRHFLSIIILLAASTVGLRFLFQYFFALPIAASAEAGPIDTMFNVHFWMIAFLFSLIMVLMLYAVFVFRRKEGDDTDGPHVHSNTKLEISWTIIPTFVVLGFGVWGAITLNEITSPKPGEMTIDVTAKQWIWSFAYPEQENIQSGELILPVGRTAVLNMNAEDVIHSFWVPEFRVKQDLVPGRQTTLIFPGASFGGQVPPGMPRQYSGSSQKAPATDDGRQRKPFFPGASSGGHA